MNENNAPLYVSCRPKRLSDFVGIDHLKTEMAYVIENGKLNVLISGMYGHGKSSLADALVLAMACEDRKGINACLECQACISLLRTPGWSGYICRSGDSLTSNAIIELEQRLDLTSTIFLHKVLCVDDFDLADESIRLKFIGVLNRHPENPFIFTASNPKILPLPILQRFYHLRLGRYGADALLQFVVRICRSQSIKIESDRAKSILITLADHNPRIITNALECLKSAGESLTEAVITSDEFQEKVGQQTGKAWEQ